jgi:hypothetical protein
VRIPDFFIVGHSKSGTTALHEMLTQHRQIYMPPDKEPWFFAEELRERPPPRPQGIPNSLSEYAAWFAAAETGQLVGEASPQYLRSRTAASRIAEVRPDARIIAIFREPASFLRSLHLQFVQTNVETEENFGRALELEQRRRAGKDIPRHTYWPKALLYSDHVRYLEQLRRYLAVFPRENVHVLIYDDFRADNERIVRGVLRFLDVEDDVPIELRESNPTVHPRSQRLNQLVHAIGVGHGPASRAINTSIKAVTPPQLRRRAFDTVRRRVIFGAPQAADPEVIAALRARCEPEVEAFSDYLGRDLVSLWGYARRD